jgi:hypothetical protein
MGDDRIYMEWMDACLKVIDRIRFSQFSDDLSDLIIEQAEGLRGLSYRLKGVACSKCGGIGQITYGDTTTWRSGGIGGQAMTDDICDKCWGTGRSDKTGADLRKIYGMLKNA